MMKSFVPIVMFAIVASCSTKAATGNLFAECKVQNYGHFRSSTYFIGRVKSHELKATTNGLICLEASTASRLNLPHPSCSPFAHWPNAEFSRIFLNRIEATIAQARDEDVFMPLSYDHANGMRCSAMIDGHPQYMVFEGSGQSVFIIPATEAALAEVSAKSNGR